MSGIMLIEGLHDLPGSSMSNYYGDYGEYLPPDVSGFGDLGADGIVTTIKNYLPGADELKEAGMAGGGVLAGLLGGIAIEKFVKTNITFIPEKAYPAVHVLGGIALGRVISRWNMPVGVGFASAMVGLGLLRALQKWFGYNIALSGDLAAMDDASMGDLSDLLGFGAADDLLPAELSQVSIDRGDGFSQVSVERGDMGGFDEFAGYEAL